MMASAISTKLLTILSLTAIILSGSVIASADDASATGDYDKDLGQFFSYTIQFVFSGADAATISWNFGDESETSTEWNPQHTYAAKGVYYVTQTVTNTFNGGSTATSTYKVEVMGFPVISFNVNGGSSVADIQQTAYNVAATQPTQPTKDGYTFTGWYTDSAVKYDWSKTVVTSFTLYAGWAVADPDTPDIPDESNTSLVAIAAVIVAIILLLFVARRIL